MLWYRLAVGRGEERPFSLYPYDMVNHMTSDSSEKIGLVLRLIFAAFLILMSGCQTSRYKEFESLRSGMDKTDVLLAIGNPTRTQRWHGRDRWEYTLYGTPEGTIVREVHFENGVSTYIGPAIKPAISATEQDRINDAKNRDADIQDSMTMTTEANGLKIQRFEPVKDTEDVPVRAQKPGVSP